MHTEIDKKGTPIPLVFNKELRFYIEFFIGMELLKPKTGLDNNYIDKKGNLIFSTNPRHDIFRDEFVIQFRHFYCASDIPYFTDYQIFIAISAIEKYQILLDKDVFTRRMFYTISKIN